MKNILISSLLLAMCAFSCEKIAEHKYVIKLYNHSTKNIMIVEGLNGRGFKYYPDTTLTSNKPFLIQVTPNDYGEILSSNKWADVINSIPSDTLSIYVFSSDTINTYDWNQIKAGYKVLKRYDLSVKDLEKTNWVINYPQ